MPPPCRCALPGVQFSCMPSAVSVASCQDQQYSHFSAPHGIPRVEAEVGRTETTGAFAAWRHSSTARDEWGTHGCGRATGTTAFVHPKRSEVTHTSRVRSPQPAPGACSSLGGIPVKTGPRQPHRCAPTLKKARCQPVSNPSMARGLWRMADQRRCMSAEPMVA